VSSERSARRRLLLTQLDEAYERAAWHGPNLRGSLRGMSPETAAWRPARGRHNVWELVLHAAYWKYAVRRRLTGEKRGRFPVAGSNWFQRPEGEPSATAWRRDLVLLDQEHRALYAAVKALPEKELDARSAGSKYANLRLVSGIAAHDLYHAGQIQLVKALLRASARRTRKRGR
jgi:uncharacterized damage-inducible protein DinB